MLVLATSASADPVEPPAHAMALLHKNTTLLTRDRADRLPSSLSSASVLASIVVAISAIDLLGWLMHIPLLTSVLPRSDTMKPNAAICLGLLGIAILFKRRLRSVPAERIRRGRRSVAAILGSACAALTVPIALAIMLEDITGRTLGIDHVIVHADAEIFSSAAGRMAFGTSICILLVAATLLLLDAKPKLSVAALLFGGGISLSALIGLIFDAGPFFGVAWLRSISIPSALSLLMLQFATLLLRPEREPLLSLTHANRSGRRQWLLLGVTVVPALVAFPLLFGMKSGLMDSPFAMALLVVVLICIQTLILWQDSKALLKVEGRRNLAEQALLQSEKLAVVGRLAASISHEINNPLEAIGNILYLVRNAETIDVAREYALMAEQELSRVAQITTQTLSFYRENRQAALYQPAAIVDSAMTLLGGKINSSRVQVTVDFRDNVQRIRCRDGELRQVVVNLISNAIEATPAGGRVVVRVRPSVAWQPEGPLTGVRILVADSGRGIPSEFRERIFEPFFTTKAHETGNGLGLWVVQDLVEKQNGSMHMRSSTQRGSQGTTFNLFLPYDAVETSSTESAYRAAEPTIAVEPA
jgi:signal transduction histidine kinase